MKLLIAISMVLGSIAMASEETWTVDGKSYTSKAQAIRYIVASGKRLEVTHTRCEILTNKLSLKACPKNKKSNFENEQFESIKETGD